MDATFSQWWCERMGRPPLLEETALFGRCRTYFDAGRARDVGPIHADGARARTLEPLAAEAFFAGVFHEVSA
jgi:hypothetical protein